VTFYSPCLAISDGPWYASGTMSLADRDYDRGNYRSPGGFLAQLTPVVKWLLILNIGIYLLDTLFLKGENESNGLLRSLGAFTIQTAVFEGRVWEFVTFQFLHFFIGHVLFNCVTLYFFGPWMERWWGSNKFLAFYLLCGVAGAVTFTALTLIGVLPSANLHGSLIGASAGIYGILIGVAVIAPQLRVSLIFPPIELTMRQLALGMLVISGGSLLLRIGGNEGGEAGHLGGALLGFIFTRYPWLLGYNPEGKIITPRIFSRKPAPKIRPRDSFEKAQDNELDRILDKISAQGYPSLTDAERATLLAASEAHKPKS
jgi:membrane associated rhomboid family serine protease